jgi:hypothetical protein
MHRHTHPTHDADRQVVQDMPVALHGIFPVPYNGVALFAAGGTEAAYSVSSHALMYGL